MKRLSGGKVCSADLFNHVKVKEVEKLPTLEFANSINKAFLEPLEEYCPSRLITCLALEKDLPKFLLGSIQERCLENNILLNPCKLCWPDRIPNWLLREYADLIAFPVCRILNVLLKSNAYLDRGNLLM